MRLGGLVLAAVVLALASATPASAEPAVALMSDATVATFDTSRPERPSSLQSISGLQSPASERPIAIDWRPRTGQVVLVTVAIGATIDALLRTYVLDPSTGAATFVGSTTEQDAADVPTGMDVNPTVDRIRMAMSNDENFRINPNNGSLAGSDTDLTPAGNKIIAEAYDRNFDRENALTVPTTLYAIGPSGEARRPCSPRAGSTALPRRTGARSPRLARWASTCRRVPMAGWTSRPTATSPMRP